MAAVALAATSMATQAAGSIIQGNAQGNIADYNADAANQNADATLAQGREQERRARVQSALSLGSIRAGYGASGVTSDGSALDVLRNSAANGELNALTIRNGADIKATAYRNEAALDHYKASNARTAGYIGAASSILGGSSKLINQSGGGLGSDEAVA